MEESERIAVLEAEIRHINKSLDAMSKQVNDMHTVFIEARGARWVLLATAGTVGFLTANLPWIAKFIGIKAP